VGKVVFGQVFSEYVGFPCQCSLHELLHSHHHLSSGRAKWSSRSAVMVLPLAVLLGASHPVGTKKQNSSAFTRIQHGMSALIHGVMVPDVPSINSPTPPPPPPKKKTTHLVGFDRRHRTLQGLYLHDPNEILT
jgi:hypothetical protein